MKERKERIQLLLSVDIWYETLMDRKYAIMDAKENAMAVAVLRVAEPVKVRLVNKNKS
jgi:hypothetical protein